MPEVRGDLYFSPFIHNKGCGRIYMFENGRIIEQGSHQELMRLGGKYAAMFEKQAYYYQDEIAAC